MADIDAFLESQDFYELMQAYRHCPIDAAKPFEAVKAALRTELAVQGEPVYHLRQYGDVTKEQLDRYVASGDINTTPQPATVQGEPFAWPSIDDLARQMARDNYIDESVVEAKWMGFKADAQDALEALKKLCTTLRPAFAASAKSMDYGNFIDEVTNPPEKPIGGEVTEIDVAVFCKKLNFPGDHYKTVSIKDALQEVLNNRAATTTKPVASQKGGQL